VNHAAQETESPGVKQRRRSGKAFQGKDCEPGRGKKRFNFPARIFMKVTEVIHGVQRALTGAQGIADVVSKKTRLHIVDEITEAFIACRIGNGDQRFAARFKDPTHFVNSENGIENEVFKNFCADDGIERLIGIWPFFKFDIAARRRKSVGARIRLSSNLVRCGVAA